MSVEPWRLSYVLAFTAFFCQPAIGGLAETADSMFGTTLAPLVGVLSVYIPLAMYLLSRESKATRHRVWIFVAVFVGFSILTLLSTTAHPEYSSVMFDADWSGSLYETLFNPLLPMLGLLLIVVAPSPNQVKRGIVASAYLTFAAEIFRFIGAQLNGYWEITDSAGRLYKTTYNMGFGYSVLFCVVVFFFLAFQKKWVALHTLLGVAGTAMVAIAGSRAPLVAIGLAIVVFSIYFWRSFSPLTRAFTSISILTTVAVTIVLGGPAPLIAWIVRRLGDVGIESRSLTALADGGFTDPNGRDSISDISSELISSGGLLGHGFYGDRFHIRPYFRWGYPHNILDEFQIVFGAALGLLLLMALVVFVMLGLRLGRNNGYGELVILAVPLTFQLTVSSSYLILIWFWALMGLAYLAVTTEGEPQISRPVGAGTSSSAPLLPSSHADFK
ncbi:MAG: hypothetical protein ACTHWM_10505 [Yaniella sp.]|uniref:hypothetical protein n=1 Tax=Yaniella sp. TaxID=2773929 RepID=UPI003F9DFC06